MGALLSQNIISLIFGITTVVTSLIALHYMRLEHRREVEEVVDGGRKVKLILSREAMIRPIRDFEPMVIARSMQRAPPSGRGMSSAKVALKLPKGLS